MPNQVSENGVYYFLGNITSHILHALPLYQKLGGTFVVTSQKARGQIEKLYGVPVVNLDNKPYKWMKPGLRPKRIHEYITFDKSLKKTYDFLSTHAKVVIFYELFEIEKSEWLDKPTKIFLTHGNMLKSYMTMYPKRLEIIKDYDYMAALGPHMKRRFISDGVNPNKLVDIGIARTDEVIKNSGRVCISEELKAVLGPYAKNKIVSYMPTFWGASSVYNTGIEIVRHLPDAYTLVFRPHPQTPQKLLRKYESLIKTRPNIFYMAEGKHKSISLVDILDASSVIIGDVSSVMLEAILARKPLVFAYDKKDFRQGENEYRSIDELVKISSSITLESAEKIGSILKRAINNDIDRSIWDATIKYNFFDYDGNSVNNIAHFIDSVT